VLAKLPVPYTATRTGSRVDMLFPFKAIVGLMEGTYEY